MKRTILFIVLFAVVAASAAMVAGREAVNARTLYPHDELTRPQKEAFMRLLEAAKELQRCNISDRLAAAIADAEEALK